MPAHPPPPVWVDTDCGIDDALALAVLVAGGLEVVGVSTVHGNVTATQAAANAAGVLHLLGARAPVRVGRTPSAPARSSGRHGPDGLGGSGWGRADLVRDGDAVEALVGSTAGPCPTVLGLGPATTLAAAVAVDPGLPSRWGRVVLVAGAGGRSSDTNTRADPQAAAALLRACDGQADVLVLGPRARWGCPVQGPTMDRLRRGAPRWWSMARCYSAAQSADRSASPAGGAGSPLLVAHDALAALVAVDPRLVVAEHRASVRAGRHGLLEVDRGSGDATVRWIDRLHPGAAERLVEALVAADVIGPTRAPG